MKRNLQEVPAPAPVLANPEPLRILVREVPAPGEEPEMQETAFEDAISIAAARRSRRGGYLKLPLWPAKALGKSAVLLDKVLSGTDLILRIRLFPAQAHAQARGR